MASVGAGAYIQEKVVIQANVQFGVNCSVHMGCLIAHDVRVGHSAFISFAVAVSGEVEIGDGAFIGANATLVPRIRIGKFATVGAGAVVIRDVPDYAVVAGNPARVVKENPRELEHGDVYADERA
jgi:acetyltransferase-like isoleucine patch superfamily enzyme